MNSFFTGKARGLSGAGLSGGRTSARRTAIAILAGLLSALPGTPLIATGEQPTPAVTVRREQGLYRVDARFVVSQSSEVALQVLTDYERIPRFMPDVRESTVLERSAGHALVEQEAVARVMMFSKRVHLVLDVYEEATTVRFRDRCGRSFEIYEGAWVVGRREGYTEITYQLTAKPSFDVPEFLLTRLLKRDARLMIERLQAEIAVRAQAPGSDEL